MCVCVCVCVALTIKESCARERDASHSHPMDGTSSSTASSLLPQGDGPGLAQPLPGAWAVPSARCLPVFSDDQVWLEELMGSLSHGLRSSPSHSACSSSGSISLGPSLMGSEGSDSVDSWSSGTAGLPRSSVERQSQQASQARLIGGAGGWDERAAVAPAAPAAPAAWSLDGTLRRGGGGLHDGGTDEAGVRQGRGCTEDRPRAGSAKPPRWTQLEQKIGAKLKFSRFLDEVTCSVFEPNSLQAFGHPICLVSKRESGLHPRLTFASTATRATAAAPPEPTVGALSGSIPGFACPVAQQQQQQQQLGPLHPAEEMEDQQVLAEGQAYLETDTHRIRGQDGLSGHWAKTEMSYGLAMIEEDKVIQPPSVPRKDGGPKGKSTFPEVPLGSAFSRYPCRSLSLPRGINLVSHGSIPSWSDE